MDIPFGLPAMFEKVLGKIIDICGVQIIVAHELFNGLAIGGRQVSQIGRQLFLDVESQDIGFFLGQIMQFIADSK